MQSELMQCDKPSRYYNMKAKMCRWSKYAHGAEGWRTLVNTSKHAALNLQLQSAVHLGRFRFGFMEIQSEQHQPTARRRQAQATRPDIPTPHWAEKRCDAGSGSKRNQRDGLCLDAVPSNLHSPSTDWTNHRTIATFARMPLHTSMYAASRSVPS